MQRHWRWGSALLLSALSTAAAADSLDINLHDEAMRISFAVSPPARRGLEMELGHYFNEGDQSITHLGLQVSGENWSKSGVFDIGMGGRIVYVKADPLDEAALAIGARVRFSPVQRVGFGGSIYYAPKIVTFLDGEDYQEFSLSVDYQVLPQAFVYVGYRNIEVDFEDVADVEFDDEVHLGMRIAF